MNLPSTSTNKYAYGVNSPANFSDPTGQDIFGGIVSIVFGVVAVVVSLAVDFTGIGVPFGFLLGSAGSGAISAGIGDIGGGPNYNYWQAFAIGTLTAAVIGVASIGAGQLGLQGLGSQFGKALGGFLGGGLSSYGIAKLNGANNTTAALVGLVGGFGGVLAAFKGTSLNPGPVDVNTPSPIHTSIFGSGPPSGYLKPIPDFPSPNLP